ncbi:MAG: SpoIIE family protein phosphatase [Armatimonadota bacterium]
MDYKLSTTGLIRPQIGSISEVLGHLHRLSQRVAEGSQSRVLSQALEIPIRCLGAEISINLHPSVDGRSFFSAASRNASPSLIDSCCAFHEDPAITRVASHLLPEAVGDFSALPERIAEIYTLEGISSYACVPVAARGELKSMLLYMCRIRRPFTDWELRLLCTIANHLAAVWHPAEPAGTYARREIAQAVRHDAEAADSTDILRQMLGSAVSTAVGVLGADSGSVMLCGESDMRVAATIGLSDEAQGAKAGPLSARVVAARKPIILNGPANLPGAVPRPEVVSSISVPLEGQHRIIGLLNVNSTTPGRAFAEDDLILARAIAQPLAVAVENAKQIEADHEQARCLASLYKMARTITSSLRSETVLSVIQERVFPLIAADVCTVVIDDWEAGGRACGHGIPSAEPRDYADLIMSLVKRAPSPRHLINIPELDAYSSYSRLSLLSSLDLNSAIVSPIIINDRLIGHLAAFRRQVRGFTKPAVRLIRGLSQLAGIAIENARLYEQQSSIAAITERQITPGPLAQVPGFEVGARYNPAHQVGGDYYDVIRISDRKYGMVVADVSGRGVSAAAHIAVCKHSLRALVPHIDSPSVLLGELNNLIYDHTDKEAFISMFYAVVDTEENTILNSSAGHEPGLLVRSTDHQVEEISTDGILLGVIPNATFAEKLASIEVGDMLMLFTDGLVEALSANSDEAFGILSAFLLGNRLKRADEITDNLHNFALERAGQQHDDIAMLAMKRVERQHGDGSVGDHKARNTEVVPVYSDRPEDRGVYCKTREAL